MNKENALKEILRRVYEFVWITSCFTFLHKRSKHGTFFMFSNVDDTCTMMHEKKT